MDKQATQGRKAICSFYRTDDYHEYKIIEEGFSDGTVTFDLVVYDDKHQLHFVQSTENVHSIPVLPPPSEKQLKEIKSAITQWLALHPEEKPTQVIYEHAGVGISPNSKAMVRQHTIVLSVE